MKKAKSTTGMVHYVANSLQVRTTGYASSQMDPLCNCSWWVGNANAKKWPLTDEPVTCKNCLRKAKEVQS